MLFYSKEDVERCKQKDLLAEILAEMTGDFPEIYEIIVKERDAYLARSLRLAAIPREVTEPDGGTTTHCPITLYKRPGTGMMDSTIHRVQSTTRLLLRDNEASFILTFKVSCYFKLSLQTESIDVFCSQLGDD